MTDQLYKRGTLVIAILMMLLAFLPFFGGKYFVSLDGSAHVYNAKLMNEMLFSQTSLASKHLEWNNFPVPNASGHFVLQFLLLIFPVWLAEKIFLLTALFILPLAARNLIRKIEGNQLFALFFIPLGFSVFYGLGFYNFIIAVSVLLLLVCQFFEIHSDTKKAWWKLFLLWGLLYFSHLLVFFIAIAIAVCYWVTICLKQDRSKFSSLIKLFLPALPFLVLAILFVIQQAGGDSVRIPVYELLGTIGRSDVLVAYTQDERGLTIIFSGILAVLLLLYIVSLFRRRTFERTDLFLLTAFLGIFAAIFILPNHNTTSGFISIRLIYLATLFFLFMVARRLDHKAMFFVLLPLFAVQFVLSVRHFNTNKKLNPELLELEQIGKLIPENSTVLFFEGSEKEEFWLVQHRYNYLAQNRNVLLFNNYEAIQLYFPLKWKDPKTIYNSVYAGADLQQSTNVLHPDYVVVPNILLINSEQSGYKALKKSEFYTLLKRENF